MGVMDTRDTLPAPRTASSRRLLPRSRERVAAAIIALATAAIGVSATVGLPASSHEITVDPRAA